MELTPAAIGQEKINLLRTIIRTRRDILSYLPEEESNRIYEVLSNIGYGGIAGSLGGLVLGIAASENHFSNIGFAVGSFATFILSTLTIAYAYDQKDNINPDFKDSELMRIFYDKSRRMPQDDYIEA